MDIELISRQPETPTGRPHLLFVHGAFHGAWCWDEHFLPWFAGQGWAAHALSLRGHGASEGAARIRSFTLETYCDDVAGAIGRIGAPVVLVGHSMGGVVAERVFHRNRDAAGLVFFAASPLRPARQVVAKLMGLRPVSLVLGQVLGSPALLRKAMEPSFLPEDMGPAERERHLARLGPESPGALKELFRRDPMRVGEGDTRPVLVVGGTEDWSIPQADHEALARQYGAPLEMCPGAHDLMLGADWQASAGAIRDWLDTAFPGPA